MILKDIEGKKYFEVRALEVILFIIGTLFLFAIIFLVAVLYNNPELYKCYCSGTHNYPEINLSELFYNGTTGSS